jgi:hypothetical protein
MLPQPTSQIGPEFDRFPSMRPAYRAGRPRASTFSRGRIKKTAARPFMVV